MNVYECGNFIRLNAEEDITLNTNVMVLYSPPPHVVPITITIDNGLTTPLVNIDTIVDGIYLSGEYSEYKFLPGQINQSGIWSARLKSNTPSGEKCMISDVIVTFEVLP